MLMIWYDISIRYIYNGLISDIISKFSQCIIFGRDTMLIAILIIGFLGCIVWGHHMFMVGFDID
jgi:heme/copper-type cytochrome/quinol oxidase subunit 1